MNLVIVTVTALLYGPWSAIGVALMLLTINKGINDATAELLHYLQRHQTKAR